MPTNCMMKHADVQTDASLVHASRSSQILCRQPGICPTKSNIDILPALAPTGNVTAHSKSPGNVTQAFASKAITTLLYALQVVGLPLTQPTNATARPSSHLAKKGSGAAACIEHNFNRFVLQKIRCTGTMLFLFAKIIPHMFPLWFSFPTRPGMGSCSDKPVNSSRARMGPPIMRWDPKPRAYSQNNRSSKKARNFGPCAVHSQSWCPKNTRRHRTNRKRSATQVKGQARPDRLLLTPNCTVKDLGKINLIPKGKLIDLAVTTKPRVHFSCQACEWVDRLPLNMVARGLIGIAFFHNILLQEIGKCLKPGFRHM